MADIQIADLSNGSLVNGKWVGTGILDRLLEVVSENINQQYNSGRIKGTDYANVYLGSMQTVITQSMQYLLAEQLQEAQIEELLDSTVRANVQLSDQLLTSEKQRDAIAEDIVLKQLQQGSTYADNIIKDKQAALLGLDNVMKNVNIAKDTTPNLVYTPQYTKE